MTGFGNPTPTGETQTWTRSAFRRVLVAVEDASQVEQAVELVRRAGIPGISEALVLHLSLREHIGGRRFPLETESSAAYVVEAAVFELRMAGFAVAGQLRRALFDQAGQAIVAEAAAWGADLIVLGCPHRRELMTRLFGSVTLRVLQKAPCPVLVAPVASRG